MCARIVVVINDPGLTDATAAALDAAGFEATALHTSMAALQNLEKAQHVELLVASADFPTGHLNGIALTRMMKLRRPHMKAVLIGNADLAPFIDGLGTFIPAPASAVEIAETVRDLMAANDENAQPDAGA